MKEYRVNMVIEGAPWRPFYEGYVDVFANSMDEAGENAKDKLRRTSFTDVPKSSMKVKSVEAR